MSKQGDGKPVKNNVPKDTVSQKSGATTPSLTKQKTIGLPTPKVTRKTKA